MAKDLKEQIEIMTHYLNGGEIEIRLKNNNRDNWRPTNNPSWNWNTYTYRIKEEKQKVTIEKWLCSDNQGGLVVIETTNIEEYTYITKKLKLIKSYEVEL